MDSVYAYVGTTFIVIIITLVWKYATRKRKTKKKKKGYADVLKFIQEAKLFPMGPDHGWRLDALWLGHRVWNTSTQVGTSPALDLCGCYSKVKGSSQNVMGLLTDTDKYPEWRLSRTNMNQMMPSQVIPVDHVASTTQTNYVDPNGVQHDVIQSEASVSYSIPIRWCNAIVLMITGTPLIKSLTQITRCWNKEENGCCWLLELINSDSNQWIFYLAQPLDKLFETDNCLLTVVCSLHPGKVSSQTGLPADILTAFQSYLLYRKIQGVPLTSMTYTLETQTADESEDIASSEAAVDTTPKAKTIFDDVVAKLTSEEGKSESMFFKRVRSLIEEKKEWYEEKKRKAAIKASEKTKARGEEVDSILSDKQIQTDQACLEKEEKKSQVINRNYSKSKLSRSLSLAGPDAEEAPSTFGQRMRQRWWSDKQSKSFDSTSQDGEQLDKTTEDQTEETLVDIKQDIDQINQGTENTLETAYAEAGREASAEILAMKSKISNIDIQLPYDQQSKRSGGWIYCGLEREVVILRKIYREGTPMQSYLGKGMISCPPKIVFEALRNPRTRFTYDDMLKKLDTLHEFPNGMKILYWYHEVSQLFKRESRDFCVLQHEHIEGSKYVISLRSVGWPACMERDDITRATLHASGWIIEPAPKNNKLYSMVTYIVQMELGHSKTNTGYLMEEMAAKQPLGIAFLRQYLVPTSSIPRPLTQKHRHFGSLDADNDTTNSHGDTTLNTLAVLAAQYGTIEDKSDSDDYKPINC